MKTSCERFRIYQDQVEAVSERLEAEACSYRVGFHTALEWLVDQLCLAGHIEAVAIATEAAKDAGELRVSRRPVSEYAEVLRRRMAARRTGRYYRRHRPQPPTKAEAILSLLAQAPDRPDHDRTRIIVAVSQMALFETGGKNDG